MDIDIANESGVNIITPRATILDAPVAPAFKSRMLDILAAGTKHSILDLSHVEKMDSAGLGAVIGALKAADPNSEIVLCGVHGMVERLFALTRMNQLFRQFATVNDALVELSRI